MGNPMGRGLTKRQFRLGTAVGLAWLLSWTSVAAASAHGKEITIEVSALTPDPQRPLTRLYQASVTFTNDREPVSDAVIELTGRRRQTGGILSPIRLVPLNVPGVYAAQVVFPRYGNWEIRVQAKEPGQGEANFVEEVLPPALLREPQSSSQGEQRSIFSISLAFSRRDVANVGMRWLHALAAGLWFGLSGLIVAAFWLLRGESRGQFWRRLYPLFPWLGGASLLLLAATGIYNAIYNSPIRPPGTLNLELMERIPYGIAYLVALGLKALTVLIGGGLLVGMAKGLRWARWPGEGNPAVATSGKSSLLLRLAVTNIALGVIMMLSVAVLVYLHNLSHLAVLVPRG